MCSGMKIQVGGLAHQKGVIDFDSHKPSHHKRNDQGQMSGMVSPTALQSLKASMASLELRYHHHLDFCSLMFVDEHLQPQPDRVSRTDQPPTAAHFNLGSPTSYHFQSSLRPHRALLMQPLSKQ
jgi:hypothetical protein